MTTLLLANLIGIITLPIAIWQFGFSSSKNHFLLINVISCLLWFVSLYLTHQYTAAWVSLTAGMASLVQTWLNYTKFNFITYYAWITALIAINISVYIAPPFTLWDLIPVIMFIWVRVSEVFDEVVMRALIAISPLAWMAIAWHGHSYGLIPGDFLAFLSTVWWFTKSRPERLKITTANL